MDNSQVQCSVSPTTVDAHLTNSYIPTTLVFVDNSFNYIVTVNDSS